MATEVFQEIINRIQTSGLNYKIELSPFSAKVILKKILTKDLNGNPLTTKFSNEATFDQIKAQNDFLYKKVVNLEQTMNNLSAQHENTIHGYHQLHQTNANLFLEGGKASL
jgi:hypothetical protein